MDWKKNRLVIGTVVLVVLGGLTVWAFSKPKDTPVEQDEEIASLPEIDKASVTSLEIHRPASGDLAAETVRLEKRDDGWWMVEPVEAEADQGVVDTALDKLAELEVERVASTNEENHARLEVDPEHAVRVVAGGAEGNLVDLWLGSFGGGSTMVRPEGQDAVLAVPGSIKFAFNKAAKDWRNRSVTDVRPTDVVAVSFQNENGTWRFDRNAEDEWTQPEGQEEIERFNSAKVQSVVASLARMRAVDFAASDVTAEQAALGEGAAVARLTVRQGGAAEGEAAEGEAAEGEAAEGEAAEGEAAEGEAAEGEAAQAEGEPPTQASTEEIVLRLGGESGDGQFYLQREGNDIIYVVSQFLADKVRVNTESFQTPEGGEQAAAPGGAPGGMPGMPGGGMPPGMGHGGPGGPGGGGQIPPEVMQQIQQQLQKQQAAGAGGGGGSPH